MLEKEGKIVSSIYNSKFENNVAGFTGGAVRINGVYKNGD